MTAARGHVRDRQRAVDLAERAGRDDLLASVYGAWTEPSLWRSRLEGFFDRTALARPAMHGPVRVAVCGRCERHECERRA
ncbi:hypothetical protein [Streptomyces griseorubiginosus]|uniref:hypothetical protein n=1 Tax=Streptomyces griseorubiginosus TaxID=67304 RepID=UPI001AD617C1|nr:hypothetical protein [Streptomyces griseorubiginosus]MBO4254388.1 hypothetical protein [Streptomyces griseorubiginosus]